MTAKPAMEIKDALTAGRNRAAHAALLSLTYVLPPLLLWARVIPREFRFHTLLAMTALMTVFALIRGHTFRDLGFRTDTLKGSLIWNGCVSVLLVAGLWAAFSAGLIRKPTRPEWEHFYVFYVLVSTPAQEFLFRSLLFAEMNRAGVLRPSSRVLMSSSAYGLAHAFYGDPFTLGATFVMGIVWGCIYHKHPNFWGVTISHAVLGVVSIQVGAI